ncbi:MAG: phosphotransferase enzyme family protein [Rudaea sp.]
MKRFFDTVSTDDVSPIANLIASRWVDPAAIVRAWRASGNFVFEVTSSQGSNSFLRFNHASERTVEAIESELAFIERATNGGIRAARALPSLDGKLVESIPTQMGTFHAVLFRRLEGEEREIDSLGEEGFEAWGQLMARLHTAGAGPRLARPAWRDHIESALEWIPADDQFSGAELEAAGRTMEELGSDERTFGLIHFDLELDNIMWAETPGLIDFDDSAYYPFAADIAFALNDLWDDRPGNIDFADARLAAFVRGYRSIRGLEESELVRLPLYLRLHNLILIARLARALSEPIGNPPEWTTKLQAKLEHAIRTRQEDIREHPLFAVRRQ